MYVIIVDMRGRGGQITAIAESEDTEGCQWLTQCSSPEQARVTLVKHVLGAFPCWVLNVDTGETIRYERV
jgi:hypothetical protein